MKLTRKQIIDRALCFFAVTYYFYINMLYSLKNFWDFEKSNVMEHYNLRSFESYMNKKFGFGFSNMSSLKNTDMFGDMSDTKLSYFKMSMCLM